MRQHRPGAMVQPPLVAIQAYPLRLDDFGDLASKIRIALRRIIEIKQSLRKSIKIVNSPGTRHGCYGSRAKVPMCRYHQQGPRPRQLLAQSLPGVGEIVGLERVHGTAVSDE